MIVEWDDIIEYLSEHGLKRNEDSDELEMTKEDFRKLLFDLDLIESVEDKEDFTDLEE